MRMMYERRQLHKRERKQILLEIAKLARQIRGKATYLFNSDKAEQIGCGCMDTIDLDFFIDKAWYIDRHAIDTIYDYNLHKIAIEEEEE